MEAAERPKATPLVGGRGTRAGARPPGTSAGRATRNRLPVIGLAAFIVAFAAAVAIAALASGGDDDPARSPAGTGAQREERAGTAGGESDRKGSKKDDAKKVEKQDKAESAPAAAPPPAEQPSAQASPQPVSTNPAQGAALNDQGFALMNAGRYEEAVPILQQAVDSFPSGTDDITYAYALFNLGKSLRLSGRPEEAIPILERRLEIPNQTEVVQRELDAARRDAG